MKAKMRHGIRTSVSGDVGRGGAKTFMERQDAGRKRKK